MKTTENIISIETKSPINDPVLESLQTTLLRRDRHWAGLTTLSQVRRLGIEGFALIKFDKSEIFIPWDNIAAINFS